MLHTEYNGGDGFQVEVDLVFGMGLVLDFLGYVEYDLVDDLGEEDADAPEEDCGEVCS